MLNHATGLKVTSGYIGHAFDREKRLALSKWARRLSGMLEDRAGAGTVVAFTAAN